MMTRSKNGRGITNYVDAKRDGRQRKFDKLLFNTRMNKVIDNFIFISLVKYTFQSFEGQKQKEKRPEKKMNTWKDKKKGKVLRKLGFIRLRTLGSGHCRASL